MIVSKELLDDDIIGQSGYSFLAEELQKRIDISTAQNEGIKGVKRYWLFAGSNYYPNGGMADFIESFDSLGDAKSKGESLMGTEAPRQGSERDWWHVLDVEAQGVIMWSQSLAQQEAFHGKRFQ